MSAARATLSTTLSKFTLLSTLHYYRPQTRFGLLGSIHSGLIAITLSLARIAQDVSLALTLLLRTQGSFTPSDSVTVTVTLDGRNFDWSHTVCVVFKFDVFYSFYTWVHYAANSGGGWGAAVTDVRLHSHAALRHHHHNVWQAKLGMQPILPMTVPVKDQRCRPSALRWQRGSHSLWADL